MTYSQSDKKKRPVLEGVFSIYFHDGTGTRFDEPSPSLAQGVEADVGVVEQQTNGNAKTNGVDK